MREILAGSGRWAGGVVRPAAIDSSILTAAALFFYLFFFSFERYLIIEIKFVNLCLPSRSISLTLLSHLARLWH